MTKKVLVYQAFEQEGIIQQTIFSIMSLLNFLIGGDNLEIWVYTDQKSHFSDFFGALPRLKVIEVPKIQIQKWKGPTPFDQRVKIEILKQASGEFKGSLFYCDSTYLFNASPMDIFRKVNERTSLMLNAKLALDQAKDPVSKNILKLINKHHFQIRNELVGIGPSTIMWDSSVLGVCQTNKYLLDYVLELTDKSYALCKKSVMEQLAFSFYLQTHSELLSIENIVHQNIGRNHQSHLAAINRFLLDNQTVDEALQAFSNFSIPLTKPNQKKSFIAKVFRQK